MLPGYNNQLNVFQPVYTHMFETILAGPQPHYYVHLYTPGETLNSINRSISTHSPSCCVAVAKSCTHRGHSACPNPPPPPSPPQPPPFLRGAWPDCDMCAGGTKNLMNPEYGLRVGSKAPLVGTLMRITSAQRTRDSRIMMVVQGLARVRVIEQTQQRPFARADVQILPDAELSSACYQEVSHFFEIFLTFENATTRRRVLIS